MTTGGVFELNDKEFEAIRDLVRSTVGIALSESKRALVVTRLAKRLRRHGFSRFRDYYEHLRHHDTGGAEMLEMINCITTNKTEFFREPHHFDWLRDRLLPELRERSRSRIAKRLRIWSAGCSTGQEPYSIAMVLADTLVDGGWDVRILASDIDTNVLAEAQAGEYDESEADDVPEALRRKYFERRGRRLAVTDAVRDLVTFRRINLVEKPWPIRAHFDAIFCRNVTIYFDQETQSRLYERFVAQLEPHGYLVAGHSENLHWLGHILSPVGATVYRRAAPRPRTSRAPKGASRRPPTRTSAPPAREIVIHSGGLHASGERTVVRTVLGSCIAACLFDAEARVGGMNHFMLPDGCADSGTPMRFGAHAMDALLAELLKRGAARARVQAKIFGGAHVIRTSTAGSAGNVPDANAAFVRKYLADAGIPILAERVGGDLPMQVRFHTHSGRAFVRFVETNEAAADMKIETRYQCDLNAEARQSETFVRAAERSGS